MTQLPLTHLEQIEFAYLVVGHTHDLIDAIFAYVSKALHGEDVLSAPEMVEVLQRKMKEPPHWKHLRDMYAFKNSHPQNLSPARLKGVKQRRHVRLSWGRDGSIILQCKRWLNLRGVGGAHGPAHPGEVRSFASDLALRQRPQMGRFICEVGQDLAG